MEVPGTHWQHSWRMRGGYLSGHKPFHCFAARQLSSACQTQQDKTRQDNLLSQPLSSLGLEDPTQRAGAALLGAQVKTQTARTPVSHVWLDRQQR